MSRRVAATFTNAEWSTLIDAIAVAEAEWDDTNDPRAEQRLRMLDRMWRKLSAPEPRS